MEKQIYEAIQQVMDNFGVTPDICRLNTIYDRTGVTYDINVIWSETEEEE